MTGTRVTEAGSFGAGDLDRRSLGRLEDLHEPVLQHHGEVVRQRLFFEKVKAAHLLQELQQRQSIKTFQPTQPGASPLGAHRPIDGEDDGLDQRGTAVGVRFDDCADQQCNVPAAVFLELIFAVPEFLQRAARLRIDSFDLHRRQHIPH